MKWIIKEDKKNRILPNGRTNGYRGYKSNSDRKRARKMLIKQGFNYFVFYRDTQAEFALMYSCADWVKEGTTYTMW